MPHADAPEQATDAPEQPTDAPHHPGEDRTGHVAVDPGATNPDPTQVVGERDRPQLAVLVGSTRPGRVGPSVARWVAESARNHAVFEVDLVDLAELTLPLLDEPAHPRLGEYRNDHTRAWSARAARAHAFVFVTPEYNHSYPAALKNAIDYLHGEWRDKPVGFVSYGGIAGGTRAVEALIPVVSVLKMVPIPEGVILPLVQQQLAENGRFEPTDRNARAAAGMFDELARLVARLRSRL